MLPKAWMSPFPPCSVQCFCSAVFYYYAAAFRRHHQFCLDQFCLDPSVSRVSCFPVDLLRIMKNTGTTKVRDRIFFFVALTVALIVGAAFSKLIYDNSAEGVAYLGGQFLGIGALLSLIGWSFWRRSVYATGAVVLIIATLSVGGSNARKLLDSFAGREAQAALKDAREPEQIERIIASSL
jgi:hypothetical protein